MSMHLVFDGLGIMQLLLHHSDTSFRLSCRAWLIVGTEGEDMSSVPSSANMLHVTAGLEI